MDTIAKFKLRSAQNAALKHDYFRAKKILEEVIEDHPDEPLIHFGLAQICLTLGEFKKGFTEFEWRLEIADPLNYWYRQVHDFSKQWKGEPLENKTILIWLEQGLGDGIQFVRYVKQLNGRVIVHSHKPLAPLLTGEVVTADVNTDEHKEFPEYDYMCSSMSLPYALKDFTPTGEPYLFSGVREAKGERKIGVIWGGGRGNPSDDVPEQNRFVPVDYFKRLDAELFNLQVENRNDLGDSSWLRDPGPIRNMKDTAEIMRGMDLIITTDTATAHLAGALGCPCWVLLPYSPTWRWGTKNTTPWYDSIQIFRQSEPGNWDTVFDRVKQQLDSFF